jgi:O-antigen ligase
LVSARATHLPVRELREVAIPGAILGLTALLLGVGAVVAPTFALAAAGGLLFMAIAYKSLAGGLIFFTLLTFFDRATTLQSGGVTPVKLLGGALVLVWILHVVRRDNDEPLLFSEQPLFAFGALAFLVWLLASTLWAEDSGLAISDGFRLAQGIALLFVVFTALREPRHLRWLIWAFIAGSLVAALLGFTGAFGTSSSVNDGRLSGGFDDPNELAAVLVPGIVLAGFAFVSTRKPIRWIFVACAPLFALALARTDSQAGLVALGVACIAALLFSGRVRPVVVAVVLSVTLAATAYYTFGPAPVAFETITSSDNTSARESLWTVAERMTFDHPLIGVGSGNFTVVSPTYTTQSINLPRADEVVRPDLVHNTYLHVLAELGVIGFVIFMSLIVGSLVLMVRAVRSFERTRGWEMEMLTRGVFIATLSALTAFAFATAQYEKQLWFLMALGPAVYALARRRERAASQQQASQQQADRKPALALTTPSA